MPTLERTPRSYPAQAPCPCCTEVAECADIGASGQCLVSDCSCTAMDGDFCTSCRVWADAVAPALRWQGK